MKFYFRAHGFAIFDTAHRDVQHISNVLHVTQLILKQFMLCLRSIEKHVFRFTSLLMEINMEMSENDIFVLNTYCYLKKSYFALQTYCCSS